MSRPRVALVVGHRKSDHGAVSNPAFENGGISEWDYNDSLARAVAGMICGMHVDVVHRHDSPGGYNTLPYTVNELRPDFIISFHLNAVFDSSAHGSETLHWRGSVNGQRLAGILQNHVLDQLGLRDRGVKSRYGEIQNGKWVGDRGSWILGRTAAPCVMGEPGFASNEEDWKVLCREKELLAVAYVRAIKEYAGVQ